MRERINRLARGILDAEKPVLSVRPERLLLSARRGGKQRVEFSVESANDLPVKGLAYSDDMRVRVLRPSFAGRKNQLFLEVDLRYAEAGETISGRISLVTDGGEKELPFLFRAEDGAGGTTLEKLTSAGRFAEIAERDPEAALRIFEYRDFVSAPFMKELRFRALYEAFQKGADRESAMEEFLIAAGAKKGALVRAEAESCEIDAEKETDGRVRLLRLREGYFRMSVQAEGDFLRLPSHFLTSRDFRGGSCDFFFDADRSGLHEGRNEGRIRFLSEAGSFAVEVSVLCASPGLREGYFERKREELSCLRSLASPHNPAAPAGEAGPEAEERLRRLRAAEPERLCWALCLAELELSGGRREACAARLEEAGRLLKRRRHVSQIELFFMDAIRVLLSGEAGRRETLARRLQRERKEGKISGALPLLLLLQPELREDPAALLRLLREEYGGGSRSPGLYAEWTRLYEEHPELVGVLSQADFAVLRFGLRSGRLGEKAAGAFAKAAALLRRLEAPQLRLLCELYEQYPGAELLTVICRGFIRRDERTEEAHRWYLRGIEARIRLTSLNEYLIYSLPEEGGELLPHEVFLYFIYDNRLDGLSREKLYENLLRCGEREAGLRAEYQKQIETFALERLLAGEINPRLAALYREVLHPGMIDRRLAAVLPGILSARRVSVASEKICSVLVLYPELREPERARLKNGVAYVPVYSEKGIFLLEDAHGNRFASVPWRAEPVCELPELMERCAEAEPEAPAQILKRLREIGERGRGDARLSPEEVRTVRCALEQLKLSDAYKAELRGLLAANAPECMDYLLSEDKSLFTRGEQRQIFSAMVSSGKWREAWELRRDYGLAPLSEEELAALCAGVISGRMFLQEEALLTLARRVFRGGRAGGETLEYLCERFSGPGDEMLRLMREAKAAGAGSLDLEERLIAQLLFTGETESLEEVFASYREKGGSSEEVARAYITDRCARYFLDGLRPEEGVFRYLELLLSETERKEELPLIYRLAWVRCCADADSLTEREIGLAEAVLPGLMAEGVYFSFYKALEKYISLPQDFTDKEMLEFRGEAGAAYEVRMRILPGQTEFRTEKMRRVYMNFFLRREILFEGESWEFEIRRCGGDGRILKSGELKKEEESGRRGGAAASRYECLNVLSRMLREKDEAALRAEMEAFAAREDLAAELFRTEESVQPGRSS